MNTFRFLESIFSVSTLVHCDQVRWRLWNVTRISPLGVLLWIPDILYSFEYCFKNSTFQIWRQCCKVIITQAKLVKFVLRKQYVICHGLQLGAHLVDMSGEVENVLV